MGDPHMEMQLAYIRQAEKVKRLQDVNAALLEASVSMYEALIYHRADSEEVDAAHTALGKAIDEALKAKGE